MDDHKSEEERREARDAHRDRIMGIPADSPMRPIGEAAERIVERLRIQSAGGTYRR